MNKTLTTVKERPLKCRKRTYLPGRILFSIICARKKTLNADNFRFFYNEDVNFSSFVYNTYCANLEESKSQVYFW